MNRTDLQLLAEDRILDAQALLDAGRWSGAYYLAGYAVECALKARIAGLFRKHDFPDKDQVFRSHTHKILPLVEAAGLKTQQESDAKANPLLARNWTIAKDWIERARYQRWTEAEARRLFTAVTDPASGVLTWIRARW